MLKVFFSYSHKDENLRNELEVHLAVLKRQRVISSWHDRRITAGREIDEAIDTELESSEIVLLLVSAYFLASNYCWEREMARALERHDRREARVIPVILHPCDWHASPLGKLRATPTDGKPVSMYANQQEAFSIVAKDIRTAAEELGARPQIQPRDKITKTGDSLVDQSTKVARSSNLRVKRAFDESDRDEFLEDSFFYIVRFFEGSLAELEARNTGLKTKLKRHGDSSFSAWIYVGGERKTECCVSFGRSAYSAASITYSMTADPQYGGINESLSVGDDGHMLTLNALGLQTTGRRGHEGLSQEGAAEYLWGMFIEKLQ